MGAWGVKLNQNDVYADVRDYYTALLRYGFSDEESLRYTMDAFGGLADDAEDGVMFWLSLADTMRKLGRLTEEVRQNALQCLDAGADLADWYQVSEAQGNARKAILSAFRAELCTEQPAKKKFGKKRYKKCVWKDGELFRYQFTGETAAEYGMCGKYMYIQKIGDLFCPDPDLRLIRAVIGETDQTRGDSFPIIRFWISERADFVPGEQDRNECIPTMGSQKLFDPADYRFYILNFPGKSDAFQFIRNAECIVPDHEDTAFLTEHDIKPHHLTWKFFEKHVIGRYLYWTARINIYR